MKALVVFVLLILVSFPVSSSAFVPIFVTNYDMADTLGKEDPLFPVYREIKGDNPIKEVIENLFQISFTEKEKEMGFSSEYNSCQRSRALFLKKVELKDGGVLFVHLEDPLFFTSGGSGRIEILKAQLEETLLQFKEVEEVVLPYYMFQP